ncbi:hypothetical protein C100_15055 [Sphingobium sp. C100]|jgi:hypothetical protein|uniref:hypothetical protein n=1 Tax=Sphingobium sp. C100 TaxID=1207055 RepID=UPI0003D65350|nr:hypothetical protein [Sphingobium sp. C100]ETI62988.1 hypothetical protein C100_15055 [Sphingobium sp. C100]
MKDYGPEALAALARGEAIVTGALAIYCDPPVFVWGGIGPTDIDGDVYLGLDDSSIGVKTGGSIGASEQAVTLTLSGVAPEVAILFDADEVKGAPAKLYRMIYDGSGKVRLDCRVFKRGRIDAATTDDVVGGTSTISLSIETAARGLGRRGRRMRSDADQRTVDPADGFFKHVSYAGTKIVYLGGKPSSASA